MVEMDETASQAKVADARYALLARAWNFAKTAIREYPPSRRTGTVDVQTSPSFHPMMQERMVADIMVVMKLSIAPRVAPLIPARSLAPDERVAVSDPAELSS
jgi:hypothetical protein